MSHSDTTSNSAHSHARQLAALVLDLAWSALVMHVISQFCSALALLAIEVIY